MLFFLIFSCKNNNANLDNSSTSINENSVIDTVVKEDTIFSKNNGIKTLDVSIENEVNCSVFQDFEIPPPSKFMFAEGKSQPDFEMLFTTSNISNYQTIYEKSIALGVFSADLVYANVFQNANFVNEYYKIVLDLSYELGITEVYSIDDSELFLNPENFDTLTYIINNSIQNTCSQLNNSNAYDKLPFVIYGGWLESVYLLSATIVNNQNLPEEFFKQLANQGNVIESLIKFYNEILLNSELFDVNHRIQSIIKDLDMLKILFSTNYKSTDYILSIDDVEKINQNIETIRNTITEEPQQKENQQQKQMLRMQSEY